MSPDEILREFARASGTDVGRLLAGASRAVNADLMSRLAAAGHPLIRPSHVAVFAGLQPGGSQISALAHAAGVSRQALSALVREVETLGYIRTSPDPDDRRAVLVELTDAGVEFCVAAIQISRDITREFERSWGSDALEQMRERLRSIAGG